MYNVKTDILKNRMYITVDGTIGVDEVDNYTSDLKKNVAMLKPGFTALLDLRKAQIFTQETMQQLQGTKEIAVNAGISKSAMVVESVVLKMQMNRNFKEVGPQDQAFTEIDEAEEYLNS